MFDTITLKKKLKNSVKPFSTFIKHTKKIILFKKLKKLEIILNICW